MTLTTQVKTITGWRTIAGPAERTLGQAQQFANRAAEVYTQVRVIDPQERVILVADHAVA